MRSQRGFTLVELLVALVVMLIVTAATYQMLTSTQRLSRAQNERVDLQSNVRVASVLLPSELREVNTVVAGLDPQNDIRTPNLTDITYRAMRGIGYVCGTPTTTEVRISGWSGLRDPVALRDSAYVFYDNDDTKATDDTWMPVKITAVDAASNCGGVPAVKLTIDPLTSTPMGPAAFPTRTPVRVWELMKLSLYSNAGKSWLGAQSMSTTGSTVEPLLGPLKDTDGLRLTYLDKSGLVTTVRENIASVRLRVIGLTEHAVARSGGTAKTTVVQDTIVTLVTLRNAYRP